MNLFSKIKSIPSQLVSLTVLLTLLSGKHIIILIDIPLQQTQPVNIEPIW